MLSAIIPTQNDERHLVPVLSALVPGVTSGLLKDVVLVDSGSTDDTATIADAAGCVFVHSSGDEGVGLSRGAAAARGQWLMFLSSRSLLAEGWAREVANFMETAERRGQDDRMAATFRLAVDSYGFRPRLAETIAAARLALLGLPAAGQGLIISRAYYQHLGGHLPGVRSHRRLVRHIGRRGLHGLRAQVLLPER